MKERKNESFVKDLRCCIFISPTELTVKDFRTFGCYKQHVRRMLYGGETCSSFGRDYCFENEKDLADLGLAPGQGTEYQIPIGQASLWRH